MIKTKFREIKSGFKLQNGELARLRHNTETTAIRDQMPVEWHSAKNFNVFDKEGNKWIDMTSGIFMSNAGHSNEHIKEALKKQIESDLWFSYFYDTKVAREFVSKLLEISPKYFEKAILYNTGSEASDTCYKLIKIWAKRNNKKYIISFNGSYHGRTLGASLMCNSKEFTSWSGIDDEDVIFIDFPNEGDKFDLTKLPPKEQIAAFVLETYQGWSAGMYPDQYIKDLYTFAREIGALVCFDEIQAGFYRMGSLYGYMTYGDFIEPDLISLGKGISSSLPIAAILGKKEIIDVPNGAAIGGTHVRNCLCCAAAKANLEFLTDEGFQNELKSKCKLFENSNKELESLKAVKKVNTKGMVSAIIFDSEEIATDVVRKCIMNGVLPVYTYKNSIKLGPPLTIQEDAIIEALEVIEAAIREVTE